MSSSSETAFKVLLVLSFAHVWLGMVDFVRLRKRHPIKGHSLPLVCLMMLTVSVAKIVNAASYVGFAVPCWARIAFVYDFITMAAVTLTVRAWRVLFYHWQQDTKVNWAALSQQRLLLMDSESRSAASSSGAKDADAKGAEERSSSKWPIGGAKRNELSMEESLTRAEQAMWPPKTSPSVAKHSGRSAAESPSWGSQPGRSTPKSPTGAKHNGASFPESPSVAKHTRRHAPESPTWGERPGGSPPKRPSGAKRGEASTAESPSVAERSVQKLKKLSTRIETHVTLGQRDRYVGLVNDMRLFVVALGFGLALACAMSIPFFIIGNVRDEFRPEGDVDVCMDAGWIHIVAATIGITALFNAYPLYKLFFVSDGYMITSEILCNTSNGAACAIALLLPWSMTRLVGIQVYFRLVANVTVFNTVTMKVLRARNFNMSFDSCVRAWVCIRARAKPSVRKDSPPVVKIQRSYTFESVLADPVACAKFEQHIKSEHSVENLLFYRAVEKYTSECSSENGASTVWRIAMAVTIYHLYIKNNASAAVNISARRRNQVCADVKRMSESAPPSVGIFSGACDEVYALMKSDSFKRFKRLHKYEDLFE